MATNQETEPHALVYRAKCALRAVASMAGDRDASLHQLRGYDLQCLLRMVEDELSDALEQMGGDPDIMRINLSPPPKDAH